MYANLQKKSETGVYLF